MTDWANPPMVILNDGEEKDPVFEFDRYADSILRIVTGSSPRYSIGIYGDWGTGKTTLMKLIQNKLDNHHPEEQSISWKEIVGLTNNTNFSKYLKSRYGINNLKRSKQDGDKSVEFRVTDIDTRFSPLEQRKKLNLLRRLSAAIYTKLYPRNELPHSFAIELIDSNTVAVVKINNKIIDKISVTNKSNERVLHFPETKIMTVWFNAWRYEREEQLASIALMKKIAYSLTELPIYKEIREILLRGIGIIGKDVLRSLAMNYAMMTEKGIDELEKKLLPKMDLLSAVDRETIYFEGIEKIESEMKKIMRSNRIVVFIDDLDRCTPDKALEVLESIKVFLDIEGFVFVVGLSYEKIEKLLDKKFSETGITGKEYLRKIIQVQFSIPDWNEPAIVELIKSIVDNKKLTAPFSEIVAENKDLIGRAVDLNPREVKRFINNFMFMHETYPFRTKAFKWNDIVDKDSTRFLELLRNEFNIEWKAMPEFKASKNEINISGGSKDVTLRLDGLEREVSMTYGNETSFQFIVKYDRGDITIYPKSKSKELLVVQALKQRWELFWKIIGTREDFREDIKKYIVMPADERTERFEQLHNKKKKATLDESILMFASNQPLWDFLVGNDQIVLGIEDWNEYLQVIESVKEVEVSNINVSLGKGDTLLGSGRSSEAISEYDRAIKEGETLEAYLKKGEALENIGNFNDAISNYDQVLLREPSNVEALYRKGVALDRISNYADSIITYDKVIELSPNSMNAFINKGASLMKLNRYEDAIKAFDTVLDTNPNNLDALYNKAAAVDGLGRYDQAVSIYEKVIELDERNVAALTNKGVALINLGKYDLAMKSLDTALKIEPKYITAIFNKGVALSSLGEYEDAIKNFDKVLDLDPRYPYAYREKGIALGNIGLIDEELSCYYKALQIDSSDYYTWYCQGLALLNQDKIEEADSSMRKSIDLNASSADPLNGLAWIFATKGEYSSALRYAHKALERATRDANIYHTIGYIYYKMEHFNKAIKFFSDSIKLDPNLPEAYYDRFRSKVKINKITSAVQDLKACIKVGGIQYIKMAENEKDFENKNDFDRLRKNPNFLRLVHSLGDEK